MTTRPVLGQENSAGLDGCRPTINSVMYGEATALAEIARAVGNLTLAARFAGEAARWRAVLVETLWSPELRFFVTVPRAMPRGWHDEFRALREKGRAREMQTYFGCLACPRGRKFPPERG